MKVVQRFPNFFDGFTPERHEVSSLEELKGLPFVKRWVDNKDFYRLSISRADKHQAILICELNEGKEYWAIAFLTEHEGFDLPSRHKPANKTI